MIRVLLVDDQPLFREGVRTLLETDPELQVVGEADDGHAALRFCRQAAPDVVVMDLQMPVMNGVDATRELRLRHPTVQVLVLTTFDDDERVFEALKHGAKGYLLKDASGAQLREAIRQAAAGRSSLAPAVASKVVSELGRLRALGPAVPMKADLFTERETQVVQLLVRGASNKEIGAALFVSEGTVKNHVTKIFEKLGVQDRTQAALRARELGYA